MKCPHCHSEYTATLATAGGSYPVWPLATIEAAEAEASEATALEAEDVASELVAFGGGREGVVSNPTAMPQG